MREPARAGIDVHGGHENVRPSPEDLLGSISVMRVDVEDGNRSTSSSHRFGGDCGVVQVARAAVYGAASMVTGRAAQRVGVLGACLNEVDRGQGNVDGATRRLPGPRAD